MALDALAAWPQTSLTAALYSAIQSAAASEPNAKTRELAQKVGRKFEAPRTH
jgi:hypothetical protein